MKLQQHGLAFAVHKISSHFGDPVGEVCSCLLQKGSLTFQDLIRFTKLDKSLLKNCLLVLTHHNFVQAFSAEKSEIGLGLTGFGVFFFFLGIIFFFDKGLLAMGNILFLSGLMLTIGLRSTMQLCMKRKNYKGTISFGIGFFLVLIGWPIFGMILKAFGFVVLFSGFCILLDISDNAFKVPHVVVFWCSCVKSRYCRCNLKLGMSQFYKSGAFIMQLPHIL